VTTARMPLAPKVTVREARGGDVAWVFAQLRLFAETYGMADLWPGDEAAHLRAEAICASEPCYIAELDGERAGFIVGVVAPNYWNPALRVLTETLWWVAPGYRGQGLGEGLLWVFEQYAARFGFPVALSTLGDKTPVPRETLERRGYRVQEVTWLKEAR
jgi:GNAT superfamily N-acetyltransferase